MLRLPEPAFVRVPLSSVLPMETTDVATGDKLGVSASLVDWNVGGTKSFRKSSLSFNADLTDLTLYTKLFPDRVDWTRPYQKLSGEAQFKSELSRNVVLKTYAGYDRTVVGMRTDGRSLSMRENNVYANATVRAQLGKGYTLFAGVAESFVLSDIDDALVAGDHYHNTRNEVHLKAELQKRFTPALKMSAGVEDYLRASGKRYDETGYDLDYNLLGAHVDANVRLVPKLFLNLSARGERVDYSREWKLMPRATLSFVPGKRFQASVMAGRYSQTPEDDYIARGRYELRQSTADHLILSMQYGTDKTMVRFEPYYNQRDVEDQEGGGNAQGMERRRHEDGGRAEQDGDVGLEAQAAGGHVAGLAEDALVDDLLAVELVFELLQLLLHLEEGGIGVFHVTAFF